MIQPAIVGKDGDVSIVGSGYEESIVSSKKRQACSELGLQLSIPDMVTRLWKKLRKLQQVEKRLLRLEQRYRSANVGRIEELSRR